MGQVPEATRRLDEAREAIGELVESARWAVLRLDEVREAHPTDPVVLALVRAAIQLLRADLVDVDRAAEELLAKAMPSRRFDVEGVGRLERHGGREWSDWRHDALGRELAVRACVDPETGECVGSPREAAERAVALVLEAASVNWRVRPLRDELGIELAEFATQVTTRHRVRMPRLDRRTGV